MTSIEKLMPAMKEALALAQRPLVAPLPNPRVGAVISWQGQIVGCGWHEAPGLPHAEVMAIKDAESKGFRHWKEADLFVTLEPCCHLAKRTPPCAPLVAQYGFRQVIIAHRDPNPAVSGNGIQRLKEAGLSVIEGVLATESEDLNQVFIKNQKLRLPYITLKLALTYDGKMADDRGRSRWITSEETRRLVHVHRAQADAIGIGARTFDLDNPHLNVRLEQMPPLSRKVVIFGEPKRKWARSNASKSNGPDSVFKISNKKPLKPQLLRLYKNGLVSHLFIEGGPRLAQSLLEAKLVDQLILHYGLGLMPGKSRYQWMSALSKKSPARMTKILPWVPEFVQKLGPDLEMKGRFHVYRTH
jgi:diaminohydroxyphosphoribosylaminopyrimidine deaminase/5-amino-6-(5-phosphoribosylamino)uracil reductase